MILKDTMPDYQNSKIYRLWCDETDKIYIGSTTLKLCNRLAHHKSSHNSCRSKTLFEISNNVKIELIENYPCNSKEELNKKEGEHIRGMDCVNKNIAGRTIIEWREDNKEDQRKKIREYKKKNKEHFLRLKHDPSYKKKIPI